MHSGEEDTFTCEICSYECKTFNQILHHQNTSRLILKYPLIIHIND